MGYLPGSGAKAGKGQWCLGFLQVPGIPLSTLFENLAGGATVDEFVEWFPGVNEQQVRAVLEHEAEALRTALVR